MLRIVDACIIMERSWNSISKAHSLIKVQNVEEGAHNV
jgi:hypothetical protein